MNQFFNSLPMMFGQTAGQQPGIGLSHLPQMAVNPPNYNGNVANVMANTPPAGPQATGMPDFQQDLYGFQGSQPGLRMPGQAPAGPQLSQAPGGQYGPHEPPASPYALDGRGVPMGQMPGGLLDDPNPNLMDRMKQGFEKLGGMKSEPAKQQLLPPPAAPAIGGGRAFDHTPYLRQGIRPRR